MPELGKEALPVLGTQLRVIGQLTLNHQRLECEQYIIGLVHNYNDRLKKKLENLC